jgi:anti-anti-sigma factor
MARRGLTAWRGRTAPDPAPQPRRAGGLYPIAGTGASTGRGRPGPGELGLRCRRSPGRNIVELSGTLHGRTRDELAEALEEALEDEAGAIVLDLHELESIDHAGLDTVLTAHLRAGDELKVLVVVPGPERVQRVLDDAQAPFVYASAPGGRTRPRRRRAAGTARPRARPHTLHRSG